MGTRQYIGARYVPIFFDNNGSSDWVQNHQYEPLTIVTYLGNSYTSKQYVPSSVGNPADNSEYWASTGIYNSQVEQYREEVQALAEEYDEVVADVEDLQEAVDQLVVDSKDVYLFITDSYGVVGSVTPFCDLLADMLGLVADETYFKVARGGASFGVNNGQATSPSSGTNFCDLLNYAHGQWTQAERDTITKVVICGGINDYLYDTTYIKTGIANAKTICNNSFKNAEVMFACIGNSVTANIRNTYYETTVTCLYEGCSQSGIRFGRCYQPLAENKTLMAADGDHPNQLGHYELEKSVFQYLYGGDYLKNNVFSFESPVMNAVVMVKDDMYVITPRTVQKDVRSLSITLSGSFTDLGAVTCNAISGSTSGNALPFTIPMSIYASSHWNHVPVTCRLIRESSGELHLYCANVHNIDDTTGAFITYNVGFFLPEATCVMIPISRG